jgi:hypothetical protein
LGLGWLGGDCRGLISDLNLSQNNMRLLNKQEYDLIEYLLKDKSDFKYLLKDLSNLMVEEMNDSGMGSLRFLSKTGEKRIMREEIAEISLLDLDGIPVSFTVNLGTDGELYELDVFKGDFSALKKFPLPPYQGLK